MIKRGRERLRKLKFRKIKTWQLILILLPLLFVDATLLRLDHIRMTELRTAVLKADEEENDEKITKSLEELKQFVFQNMVINVVDDNGVQRVTFGTGPFYLEHSYIRAANAALQEAEKNASLDENPNGNIYQKASNACRGLAISNGWSWDDANYINCMMSEIQKYPEMENLQDKALASLPSTELYRKNFASPVWAPTLAGWLILVTFIIIVVIFIRMIVWIVLRLSLLFI